MGCITLSYTLHTRLHTTRQTLHTTPHYTTSQSQSKSQTQSHHISITLQKLQKYGILAFILIFSSAHEACGDTWREALCSIHFWKKQHGLGEFWIMHPPLCPVQVNHQLKPNLCPSYQPSYFLSTPIKCKKTHHESKHAGTESMLGYEG